MMKPVYQYLIFLLVFTIYQTNAALRRWSMMQSMHCINETTFAYQYIGETGSEFVNCQGTKKWCDSNKKACVSEKPMPRFFCPSENGYYPLMGGCNGFTICQNGVAYQFRCDSGEYYDPSVKKCSKSTFISCFKFNCDGQHGRLVAHDYLKRTYALCVNGQPASFNECHSGWFFDDRTQKCKFACSGEGYMHDIYDSRKYFQCVIRYGSYETIHKACPDGMIFDVEREICTENKALFKLSRTSSVLYN